MKITSQHKMYDPVYEVYDQGNNLTTFYLDVSEQFQGPETTDIVSEQFQGPGTTYIVSEQFRSQGPGTTYIVSEQFRSQGPGTTYIVTDYQP